LLILYSIYYVLLIISQGNLCLSSTVSTMYFLSSPREISAYPLQYLLCTSFHFPGESLLFLYSIYVLCTSYNFPGKSLLILYCIYSIFTIISQGMLCLSSTVSTMYFLSSPRGIFAYSLPYLFYFYYNFSGDALLILYCTVSTVLGTVFLLISQCKFLFIFPREPQPTLISAYPLSTTHIL
jgi:hypothetical protein